MPNSLRISELDVLKKLHIFDLFGGENGSLRYNYSQSAERHRGYKGENEWF